jgi:tetratricopeptide (TPR) repeat protein
VAEGDDLIGQTLAQFRIESKLGEGGMGVVYRATDTRLRREVALKVLPDALAGDDERKRRFLREARSAAAVTHPNIATVYDVGEAAGHVFIAMELVAGETLRDRMEPGLTRKEAVRIAKEIARGLRRAHEKGVVHRDLKPENVMVTPDGEVKILDFGLAKLREGDVGDAGALAEGDTRSQVTADGRIMGTPPYMSPEQAQGRGDVDARSDVFSFGVMLYEMLAGVRPFRGSTTVEVLYGVLHREPESLGTLCPGVPGEVSEVVARCLRKERAERFFSGKEVVAALEGDGVPRVSDAPSGRALAAARVSTVDGMGTALGATIAHSDSLASASASGAPRRSGGRRVWVGVVVVAALLAGGGGFWAKSRHAGRGRGVAMTDHPLPKTDNAEARAHYASGLSRLRVGALQSNSEFRKAVALDPTLAAAQLRLAVYGSFYKFSANERRSRFTKASELKDRLEPRDAALLPVAAAVAASRVDFEDVIARARVVAERYPDDAEMALIVYLYLIQEGGPDEADAMGRHVLELDPTCTQVLNMRADRAIDEGELDVAASELDRCLALSPMATMCLGARVELEGQIGRCSAELSDARLIATLEPDVPVPELANALIATAAASESVRAAFRTLEAHRLRRDSDVPGFSDMVVASTVGDFGAVDRLAAAGQDSTTSSSERDHTQLASIRIAVAEETGDRLKALSVAEAFSQQASAWTPDAPLLTRAKRLYLLHESHGLDDSAFVLARDRLLDESLSHAQVHPPIAKDHARLLLDAQYAESAVEVRKALGAGPLDASPKERFEWSLDLGRALFLAGRIAEALPFLTKACDRCEGSAREYSDYEVDPLGILDYFHAHLLLGQALEATHDTAGACRAYAVIQTRWKDAKPRSITLETANEHAHALNCPPPSPQ